MRRSRTVWSVVAIVLAACLPQVIGEARADGPGKPRWYVSVGAGGNWMPGMRQVGHNRDGTCYPNNDCTGVAVDGYRWVYDPLADDGRAFEVAAGYRFDGIRFELSASQRKNRLEQRFRSIAYRDGSAIADDPSSPYRSSSRASIDALRTRTLMLSAYRDFPLAGTAFTPYLGAGAGVSRAEVKGLYFRSRYSCAADCDAGPPERYDSWQQDDMSDTVLSGHLHAGVDYRIAEAFSLGLKLTWNVIGKMADESPYRDHAVPGMTSTTEISDMSHWSLLLGVKYMFGD